MNRTGREIVRREWEGDISGAIEIAKKAGYCIRVYDGDGENGMCEPEFEFLRKRPTEEADSLDHSIGSPH
mgnify:CR=1 FL=1